MYQRRTRPRPTKPQKPKPTPQNAIAAKKTLGEAQLLTEEKDTKPLQVIFYPERGKNLGTSPRRFPRPPENIDPDLPIEVTATVIIPGRNSIPRNEWNWLLENKQTVASWVKKSILVVVEPTYEVDESEASSLAQYEEDDAILLVENTYDRQELELAKLQDGRTNVIHAIDEQLQVLDDAENREPISMAASD